MEPDVIRMYSSSPPPMEDGAEEDDDEFGDFSGVPNSISLTEFDVAATFSQSQTLTATSPPELLDRGGLSERGGSAKANGVVRGRGDGEAVGRTVSAEELKQLAEHAQPTAHNDSKLIGGRDRTDVGSVECNGSPDDSGRLTNGFAAFDEQGSPSLNAHAPAVKLKGSDAAAIDGCPTLSGIDNEDDFADFEAFSYTSTNTNTDTDTNSHAHSHDLTDQKVNWGNPFVSEWQTENVLHPSPGTAGLEENGGEFRDSYAAGMNLPPGSTGTSEGLNNGDGDGGSVHSWPDADVTQRDMEADGSHAAATQCVEQTKTTLNGEVEGGSEDESLKAPPSMHCVEDEQSTEKRDSGSGNDSEPETETETSFGRPLSTDALEEFGDFSTTGSVPSPPLQEETATPADHSQMAEDGEEEEEEFGDFGDFSSTGGFGSGQEFSSFSSPQRVSVADVATTDAAHTGCKKELTSPTEEASSVSSRDPAKTDHQADSHQRSEEDHGNLPVSDSFADFHSAPVGGETSGGNDEWTAFDEQPEDEDTAAQGESWASFGPQQTTALSEDTSEGNWQEGPQLPLMAPPSSSSSSDGSRTDGTTVSGFVV